MKWPTIGFATVLLAVFCPLAARADVVVPNGFATNESGSNNGFPFDLGAASQRYQQVYSAAEFSSLSGPTLISGISFRPDAEVGSAFSSILPDVQIDLSTTSAAPGGLSNVFSANVGANDLTVFARGPLSLSSSFTGPAAGPKAFDIHIPFAVPFLYDPSQGNLLLDVRNFGGGRTTAFDAIGTSVYSRAFANDATASQATNRDALGLITQFNTTAASVPEPASLIALLLGTSLLGATRVLRRRKH